ncbi:MAG: DNA-deoxyinosine glycosylase [Clostridium sp.]|nr:DNA-deoxyinosine glycosylase [Clostridium sp.]
MKREFQTHPFGPIYDKDSKILILGSFPSVKSREESFFYAHKQNRFWKVIQSITNSGGILDTDEEKARMLLESKIALWDTIASCDIIGSSDASITNVKPNDLREIINHSKVKQIYCNGTTSYNLYQKYVKKDLGISAIKLPSTSPANAAWSLEQLILAWDLEITQHL